MAGRRVFTRGVTSSSFCPLAHAARRAERGSPGASQGAPPVPLVAKWAVLTRSKRTGVSYDVAVTVVPTAEGDAPTPPLAPAGAGPAGSCPSAAAFGAGADSRCGECWTLRERLFHVCFRDVRFTEPAHARLSEPSSGRCQRTASSLLGLASAYFQTMSGCLPPPMAPIARFGKVPGRGLKVSESFQNFD